MKKIILVLFACFVLSGCAVLPDASGCTTDFECAQYVGYEDLEYQGE